MEAEKPLKEKQIQLQQQQFELQQTAMKQQDMLATLMQKQQQQNIAMITLIKELVNKTK